MHKFIFPLFILLQTATVYAQFEPLPKKVPIPADNPQTPAKIELGQQLFFDPRLSKTGTVSCNTCHNVMLGGDDNRANSFGIHGLQGARSAPTVWNSAFLSVQFWDGRAPTLEEQAKGPIINPKEMGMDNHNVAIQRIQKIPGYQKAFEKVFGAPNSINIDNIAKAIASYERTLITPNSPFDKFMRGDKKALSAEAQKGMKLVQTVGCVACHMGPNFAGPALPTGTGFFHKFPTFPNKDYEKKYKLSEDTGRHTVTNKPEDKNMWRVPTWRNIALTAPYFHNGSVKTLDEAVRVMAKTQLNKDLTPEEVTAIVAFLNSLTGEFPKQKMVSLPPTLNESLID